jgi:hypothetical protein
MTTSSVAIAQDHYAVKRQARFRAISVNEFIDGVTITLLGVRTGETAQDCGFCMLEIEQWRTHTCLGNQVLRASPVGVRGYELAGFFSPVSSRNNHALAIFQSRLAVSAEIRRASAVSSTLKPPK